MSKKITREEISNEMQLCMQEVDRIREKLMIEGDSKTRMAYIEKMVEYADRISELDTMNKKLLLKDIKKARRQAVKELLKLAKQQLKVELS